MSEQQPYARHYDVIVVGGRCAGAASALLLARAGARVLLLERQKYGSDTVSTHALMRGGVMQLKNWGLLPEIVRAGTPQVRQSVFHYGQHQTEIAIAPEYGVDFLLAPRRWLLDRVLVDAARSAGVDVRHGVTVRDLLQAADGRIPQKATR